MKNFVINWIVNTLAIALVVEILPWIEYDSFGALVLTSLFIGVFGPIIRAILILFTLPLFILTLGLIYFIINALILYLASAIISGFSVDSFWAALIGSLLISLVSMLINWMIRDDRDKVIVYRS
ncbi:MAG: phage holin family protein [candidate division Zixibacteria bacterium]|nr:phage holin family protein [candidate division Zixibacteria bacterium]